MHFLLMNLKIFSKRMFVPLLFSSKLVIVSLLAHGPTVIFRVYTRGSSHCCLARPTTQRNATQRCAALRCAAFRCVSFRFVALCCAVSHHSTFMLRLSFSLLLFLHMYVHSTATHPSPLLLVFIFIFLLLFRT